MLGRVGSHLAIFAIGGQGLEVQAMGLKTEQLRGVERDKVGLAVAGLARVDSILKSQLLTYLALQLSA